jgi:hypothetical protein
MAGQIPPPSGSIWPAGVPPCTRALGTSAGGSVIGDAGCSVIYLASGRTRGFGCKRRIERETTFKLVRAGCAGCTEALDHLTDPVDIDHVVFITETGTGNPSKTG